MGYRASAYFTGRLDNFDPTKRSTNHANGRLDPEGIRVTEPLDVGAVAEDLGQDARSA